MQLFDKTQLPQKVHLSGPDCFHFVLDKHAQKHDAGGNVMRQVFYFNTKIDAEKIKGILLQSPIVYWMCNIKIVTGSLFKIPYWLYTDKGNTITVFEHYHAIENELPNALLERDIELDAERFIECDIVHYAIGKSAIVLSWNHILMDGRGTGLLFQHLSDLANGKESNYSSFFPKKEVKKVSVSAYIKNMYKVKAFIEKSCKAPIASVASKNSKSEHGIHHTNLHFTIEETKTLETNAAKNGAMFGANIFQIACCVHAVNRLNKQRKKEGTIWLPIPYDGRTRGAVGPIISNHVSFLFYRLKQACLGSPAQTVAEINAQMKKQISVSMPKCYDMLLRMMRHIPLDLYYFLVSGAAKGSFASFLYTTTGENFNKMDSMFGEPIQAISIIPAATFPPGLTFIFLKHAGALNINIAYSPDVIKKDELYLIEQSLKDLLLVGH